MDFRKKINFFSQFGKTGSLLPCIGDDTVFDYIMFSLINLCLKKTLGGDSIIFCSRINLLFFVCVVTKGEFWLKYLVFVRHWWYTAISLILQERINRGHKDIAKIMLELLLKIL